MRALYEAGPHAEGFYPGDSIYALNWFAFDQFEKAQATLHSAFVDAALDVATIESDIHEVKYFWSRQNWFFDPDVRSRLCITDLVPAGNGLLRVEYQQKVSEL